MKSVLIVLSLVLPLFLVACSQLPTDPQQNDEVQQPGAVQLQAERTSPTTILLTLRNQSASSIGYNLCSSAFERRSGSDWQRVPSDLVCTAELRILAAGDSATFTRQIASDLPAGDYRFVTQVESPLGGRGVRIVSNTITIR